MCSPAPQEYMRTHWAMRRLASLLSQRGFHVLRFDYSCTGDSAGESRDAALADWRRDIGLATAELKDMSGVNHVSVVGLRLGATLAAQATAEGVVVRDLVLWEPVVKGDEYVEGLMAVGTRKFARLLYHARAAADELVGFPFPEKLARDTRAVDMLAGQPKAKRTVLVASEERPEHAQLIERLTAAGLAAKRAEVRDEASGSMPEATLLSTAALQTIVRSLEEP
ncbi:MAG: alpha/beta fold hydrolase [Myxococcota bacterium]|nr:alpha/beta fold hydrolase [Myxococcota bacterium]